MSSNKIYVRRGTLILLDLSLTKTTPMRFPCSFMDVIQPMFLDYMQFFQIGCCRSSRCPIHPLLRSPHALAHSCLFVATTWFCTWGYSWAKLKYSASPNTKSWKPSTNEEWELVDKHTNILTLEWDRCDKSSVKHPTSPQWGQPQEPAIVTCSLIHSPSPAFFPLTHWASRNHLPKNLLAFKAVSQVCFWKNPD